MRLAVGSHVAIAQPEPCTVPAASFMWAWNRSKPPKSRVSCSASSPSGLPPPWGDEVRPEHRVQDVAGHVERQVLLELGEGGEVVGLPGLGEGRQRGVGPLHVGGVVLAVVQLHDLAADVGFQGGVVVVELGRRVGTISHAVLPTPEAHGSTHRPGAWM